MNLPRLNYKNLSAMQTVDAIYQLMLNRSVDAAGKARGPITLKQANIRDASNLTLSLFPTSF